MKTKIEQGDELFRICAENSTTRIKGTLSSTVKGVFDAKGTSLEAIIN